MIDQPLPVVPSSERQLNRVALEKELRGRLEGVRLVCEIDIDDGLHSQVSAAISSLAASFDGERIVRLYPATLVVYLVGEGIRHYDGGFWVNLTVPLDQIWAGPGFLTALSALGLPQLEEETDGGFAYVSKILLHGGIPRYCARDVLELIGGTLAVAPGEAADLLQRWQRDPGRVETLDKPAQRFVLHGGLDSLALIDRVIDLFRRVAANPRDPLDESGLPGYMTAEFKRLPDWVRNSGRGLVRPRPRVELADGGAGPVVILPPYREGQKATWRVDAGNRYVVRSGSSTQSQAVPLDPCEVWRVDLDDGQRSYRYQFARLRSVPLLFFDASSRVLLKRHDRVMAGTVLALAPKRFEFRVSDRIGPPVPRGDGQPELGEGWARYCVQELIVEAGETIWCGDPGDSQDPFAKIPVSRPPVKPTVEGETLPRIWANGVVPVYVGPVSIMIDEGPINPNAYQFRCESLLTGVVTSGPLVRLPRRGAGFGLAEGSGLVDLFELDVRGPLGNELRHFQYCQVQPPSASGVPDDLIGPDETLDVWLQISGTTIEARCDGGQTAVVFPKLEGVEFSAEVPRLRWALRRARVTSPLSVEPLTVTTQEIEGLDEMAIVVAAVPHAWVTMSLRAEAGVLQSQTVRLGAGEAVASFQLGAYSDTINASPEARLGLEVKAGHGLSSTDAFVATVVAEFTANDLDVTLALSPVPAVVASWSENQRFANRCLRLWPVAEPRSGAQVFRVADADGHEGERCSARWEAPSPGDLIGGFLAEISVEDRWTRPLRPRPSPAATYVELGRDHGQLSVDWLEGCDQPMARLAKALWAPSATAVVSQRDLNAAASWLLALTAVLRDQAWDNQTAQRLEGLLFRKPDAGARALVSACRDWEGEISVLQLLAVVTLSRALDAPAGKLRPNECEELAELLPVTWAAMDVQLASELWKPVTGWSPQAGRFPDPGLAVNHTFPSRSVASIEESVARLYENTKADERSPSKLLSWGRHQVGVFQWLSTQNPTHRGTRAWQARWSALNSIAVRGMNGAIAATMRKLTPPAARGVSSDPVLRFPADVLATSVHVVAGTKQKAEANRALVSASCIAPELTQRCVLLALALQRGRRAVGTDR